MMIRFSERSGGVLGVAYQLARSYQATGRTEDARRALADYEQFRKAVGAGSEARGQGVAITPP